MLGLARFLILAAVALTVIYGSLWFYLRARRREYLEIDWAAETEEVGTKDEYVRERLIEYDTRRRKTLFWSVYVMPLCLVTLIIYLTNYH